MKQAKKKLTITALKERMFIAARTIDALFQWTAQEKIKLHPEIVKMLVLMQKELDL